MTPLKTLFVLADGNSQSLMSA